MQRRLVSLARPYSTQPWFINHLEAPKVTMHRPKPPPLPENAPRPLRELHAHLTQSPHLEPSSLVVSESVAPPAGPELPYRLPHGRRKRGGTYAGESAYDVPGGIWNWVLMAQVSGRRHHRSSTDWVVQVKEGTEDKGAIESVVRVIRKTVGGLYREVDGCG